MFHLLQRHPFAVEAHFQHVLVLTYAYPPDLLAPLVPPGLTLDTFDGWGFLAVAVFFGSLWLGTVATLVLLACILFALPACLLLRRRHLLSVARAPRP